MPKVSIVGTSSVDNPIQFFDSFFETNSLPLLRKEFFNELNDPESAIHKYPSTVDFVGEKYTIEFEREIFGKEIADVPGYEYNVVEESQWDKKIFFFQDFLNNRFKKEFFKSCSFIDELLNKERPLEHSRNLCHLWVNKLRYYIHNSIEGEFMKYDECARPLEALIRYLLEKYPLFCPSLKEDGELKSIQQKSWASIEGSNKKILKSSIYKALSEFENSKGELLFEDVSNSDIIEKQNIIDSLSMICRGDAAKVKYKLKSDWGSSTVHYIIRQLKYYHDNMKLKDLENFKSIIINNKPFNSNSSSVGATRFEENKKKVELKKTIDHLFNEHLM